MATGEFEYVKPPHFYIEDSVDAGKLVDKKDDVEEIPMENNNKKDFSKTFTDDEVIEGIQRGLTSAEEKGVELNAEQKAFVEDPEQDADVKLMRNTVRRETAEIEIEIDDDTSTTKILVKEASKPTRGRTPKLNGVEDEVAAKYRDGTTLKELAEVYNVSVPCVSNALKRAGETVRSRGRQKRTDNV